MTQDKALKMALEALEKYEDEWLESGKRVYVDDEITAIKEALAQPEQEPVRIMGFNCKCGRRMEVSAEQGVVPAPQRKPLTDEEIEEMCKLADDDDDTSAWVRTFARAIEAAHGIKE